MKLMKKAASKLKNGWAYLGRAGRTVALGAGAVFGMGASTAMAVPITVPFTAIDIDFATVATAIIAAVTLIVVAGISVGLVIYAFKLGYNAFKQTAR